MHPLTGCLRQMTTALQTPAKTGRYAGSAGTATPASACRGSRALTVRLMWTSVFHSPAGTEPPVWTEWAGSPVCVPQGSPVSGQISVASLRTFADSKHIINPNSVIHVLKKEKLVYCTPLALCIYLLHTPWSLYFLRLLQLKQETKSTSTN